MRTLTLFGACTVRPIKAAKEREAIDSAARNGVIDPRARQGLENLVDAPRAVRWRAVGELVFAIGHPGGQPWTLTAGVVSALDGSPGPDPEQRVRTIRSDVRLAPGSSGGPLLDARGNVIGLNAMVMGGDLALAIPVDLIRRWVDRVR